jgi:hypothetical protein
LDGKVQKLNIYTHKIKRLTVDAWSWFERAFEEIREHDERIEEEIVRRSLEPCETFDTWGDVPGEPITPEFLLLAIFLIIRGEVYKEREWFESLKENLRRVLAK